VLAPTEIAEEIHAGFETPFVDESFPEDMIVAIQAVRRRSI
jgi:hypothetical protein